MAWPIPRPGNRALQQIQAQLNRIEEKVDAVMSEQSQQQADINSAVQFDQQLDADIKNLTARVTAGMAALDQAIANLQAANPAVDTSQLVAAQAVLAGDQPNLDAAVAALAADPHAAPATPPAGG
jgi:multidrug resistance efflux pump